jgi:phosphate/sulfate permease
MTVSVLLILILLAGFYMAWSIGANDVANAMGTSVGSGALTLKSALAVAAVLEFCGAFFFGSHVSETMQRGIIYNDLFVNEPRTLLLGMVASLIGTGIWLQIASYFGWPVSTTHAIVGAIVGFGALIGGFNAVQWDQVMYIVASWVISPLIGGILGYAIFNLIRQKIFHAAHPLEASKKIMPWLVFAVLSSLTLVLLFNGLENLHLEIAFLPAAIASLAVGAASAWIAKLGLQYFYAPSEPPEGAQYAKADFAWIEKMFGWLQILSACMMAFAHGANDVANAIGPLSAALFIYKNNSVNFGPLIPSWVLALGGLGIVVGLATWGWRVIETVGKKITELTPTRGFSAEFGASLTILVATRLGMPISATHTLVGAVIGVGLARGIEALNLGMTREIVVSWIITLPAGALCAVAVFELLNLLFSPYPVLSSP